MRPIAVVMLIFGAMLLPTVLSAPLAQPDTPNTNSTATLASPTDHCQLEETRGFQVLNCGHKLYRTPSIEHCNLTEVNGYLQYICGYTTNTWKPRPLFKCPNSDYLYSVHAYISPGYTECDYSVFYSFLCPDDPGFYQACGHKPAHCSGYKDIGGNLLLCGAYLCQQISVIDNFFELHWTCEEGACSNTDLNMVGCEKEDSPLCDNVCDEMYCEDESNCNGAEYGMWCHSSYDSTYLGYLGYLPPAWMCDGLLHCGEDEEGCYNWEEGDATCNHTDTGREIKLKDEMRCFPPRYTDASVCKNGEDHTNCSDPERISMQCLSNGYPTNVSIFGYCKGFQLCDDDYNNACVELARGCEIHKAQMCDGNKDCHSGTDEESGKCGDGLMTSFFRCKRRFSLEGTQRPFLSLPLAWAMDGEIDCLNGEDEDEGWWVKCGNSSNSRFYELGTDCSDVSAPTIRDCADQGVERNIIDTSIKFGDQHYLPGCNNDVETQLGDCQKLEHTAGIVSTAVMGIQPPIWINLPRKKIDCSYLYGENYVYAACNDLCFNATCPLQNSTEVICKNKADFRVFALAKTSSPALVTLIKKTEDPGSYENQLFPCDNKNCVLYKDVCNLRDDCGDGSDEKNCTNLCPADSGV